MKKVSPMWITFPAEKWMIASPSVCAGGTCTTWISSSFKWNATPSMKVTMGSALAGEGSTLELSAAINCSLLMRVRTLSCATMMTPALAKFSLPPV